MKFVCPKCYGKLNIKENGTAVCDAGHSYDRSRYGYYNLLMASTGGVHGDNREMIEARRAFLDTGAYSPLADKISELASQYMANSGVLLDVGCGEGYYTEKIISSLSSFGKRADVIGFDISKDAAKYSARRCKGAEIAVASAYKMPIADSTVDLAVNVFSPLAREETHRVLKRGGKFIMAIPDKRHLFGLKSALYKTPYENEVADSALDGFSLVKEERVAYTLELADKKAIGDLFMMTPYAYRTPIEARDALSKREYLKTEIEFIIFVYEKNLA